MADPGFRPARTPEEFAELTKRDESGFIKTREEWEARLANRFEFGSPLAKISERELQDLSDSLVFNEKGLAGGKYMVLAMRLNYFEFEAVLNEFGIGMEMWDPIRNARCVSTGTCQESIGFFCTDNC